MGRGGEQGENDGRRGGSGGKRAKGIDHQNFWAQKRRVNKNFLSKAGGKILELEII